MKRISLLMAAFLMVVFAHAQNVDCDQGDGSNNFENGFQMVSGFDIKRADDFLVSAGNTLNIQTISINVITQERINQIEFIFFEDDNGAPGIALPETVTNSPDADHQVLVGEAFGYNVYQVYVDVNLNFEGGTDGATYWMQPTATAATGVVNVFWEVTSVGTLGQPIHSQGAVDAPGGAWTADADGNQGVFTLYCEQTDPPEPPVLPCVFAISNDVEPITRVVFSDIDNTSSADINGSPALEDFTSIEGNITTGTAYDITLKGNTNGGYTCYFTAFIDYSGDWSDFDIFEIGSIVSSTGTDTKEATGTITLDESVADGTYTMRIIKNYNSSPINPCASYGYGQGEDYTLIVSSGEPGEYCIPDGASNGGDEILNFTLSDLSNDSDPSEGVDGYSNYSDSVDPANIQAGETYVASLTSGGGNLMHGAAIWIDYNDNGIFEASEMVASIPVSIPQNTTVDFPPFTVADFPGTHRLRVQYAYNVDGADMDPCTVTYFTETEDYSVEVAAMIGCVGIPEAGVAVDDFSVCPNASFNISVTGATSAANGLVRIWESSLAGEASWSEMSGASGSIYLVEGITVSMDYRYKLSCNEGDAVYSDVISVSLSPLSECYCIPEFLISCDYTGDMIDDFILVGEDGTEINNPGTGCSDDNYDDRTDESVNLYKGVDYTATVTTDATQDAVAIWIDFNDDGVFDESERVATGDLDTSTEITISIPADANAGEHRMRVMVAYAADPEDNDDFDACNSAGNDFGETHDYMVIISDVPVICGFENFDNAELTESYADGSFVGNDGITWTYVASRDQNLDENNSGIEGNAIMLRRVADNSAISSSTIAGGIGNFSVKLYKGFTGGGDRQVELFVNGDSYGVSDPFDDLDVHVFQVTGIDIAGDIEIEIKNITAKQIILDDITWTCGPVIYDCPEIEANIGDACDDGDDMTENDVITEACECEGTLIVVEYDCPDIEKNYGDDCVNAEGEEGTIDANCDCYVIIDNINDVAGFNFTMYPNPVDRTGSLTLSSNQSIDRYEVLDITGKIIDAKSVSNQNEIEVVLTNYSSGLYILKAYSGSVFSTQKMIVR